MEVWQLQNQIEWKPDNYQIKETTFIQTGRRGADAERAGPTSMCGEQKFGRDILGVKSPSPTLGPQPRVPVPGRYVPTTCGCKNQQGLRWWKKLLEPQAVPLKEPTHRLSYSDVLSLSSSTMVATWKAQVIYCEKLKCLASRWAVAIVPFWNPHPTEM